MRTFYIQNIPKAWLIPWDIILDEASVIPSISLGDTNMSDTIGGPSVHSPSNRLLAFITVGTPMAITGRPIAFSSSGAL